MVGISLKAYSAVDKVIGNCILEELPSINLICTTPPQSAPPPQPCLYIIMLRIMGREKIFSLLKNMLGTIKHIEVFGVYKSTTVHHSL